MALVVTASSLPAQVPSKIPSDTEAQIFNLIKRVTALEEQVAAPTNGSATLRVRVPFIVTDAAGHPILQVTQQGAPMCHDGVVIAHHAASDAAGLAIYNTGLIGNPAPSSLANGSPS